jgi:hypothetical protein
MAGLVTLLRPEEMALVAEAEALVEPVVMGVLLHLRLVLAEQERLRLILELR